MSELFTATSRSHLKVAHRYPTRIEVEDANDSRLAQIMEDTVSFFSVDRPGYDERGQPVSLQRMARVLNRLVALATVVLKVIRATCCYCICLTFARSVHKLCSSRHVVSFGACTNCNPDFRTLNKAVWSTEPPVR